MKKIFVATSNPGKLRDFAGAAAAHNVQIEPIPNFAKLDSVVEDGMTFEENARKKADQYSLALPGEIVLADDSGLEVDALGGAPGIYSARYAGPDASDNEKIEKLLEQLGPVSAPKGARRARFRCVLALARKGDVLGMFEEVVEGEIADRPRGSHGFGYDPIFIPNGFQRTFGELDPAEKNQLSHRARALEKLAAFLIVRPDQQKKRSGYSIVGD